MVAVPNTRTRMSHALHVRAFGRVVGGIFQWDVSQSRTIDREYELGPNEHGLPRDQIPQDISELTIRVSRFDLYTDLMEEVFGNSEFVNLCDQYRPFSLREIWAAPAGGSVIAANVAGALGVQNPLATSALATGFSSILNGGTRLYDYLGGFFTTINRRSSSTDDRTVRCDGTLICQVRRRTL